MKNNIIITGVGGQGVITAGLLISEAATKKGIKTVMSEIHGLAQRGGSVSVDIRMGDVYSPIVPDCDADLLMGFEPIETVRYVRRIGKNTKIIVNTERMTPISLSMERKEYPDINELIKGMSENFQVYPIDSIDLARKAGNHRASNVVMVGAALALGALPLTKEDIIAALKDRFSGKLLEINLQALEMGINAIAYMGSPTH